MIPAKFHIARFAMVGTRSIKAMYAYLFRWAPFNGTIIKIKFLIVVMNVAQLHVATFCTCGCIIIAAGHFTITFLRMGHDFLISFNFIRTKYEFLFNFSGAILPKLLFLIKYVPRQMIILPGMHLEEDMDHSLH